MRWTLMRPRTNELRELQRASYSRRRQRMRVTRVLRLALYGLLAALLLAILLAMGTGVVLLLRAVFGPFPI
jgi:hypothetical protein